MEQILKFRFGREARPRGSSTISICAGRFQKRIAIPERTLKAHIKHVIKKILLKTGYIKFAPSFFPGITGAVYMPGKWGGSPDPSFRIFMPHIHPIAEALKRKRNRIYAEGFASSGAEYISGSVTLRLFGKKIDVAMNLFPREGEEPPFDKLHAALFFESVQLESALNQQTIPKRLAIVLVPLSDSSEKVLSAYNNARAARHPITVLEFKEAAAVSLSDGCIPVRSFDLPSEMTPVQRDAFIASRIEEAITDTAADTDPVLSLSQKYESASGQGFARRTILQPNRTDDHSDITFVIPTLNAGPEFRDTLRSIREQRLVGNNPILIVDSGSTDETLPLAREYGVRVLSIDKKTFNHGATRDFAVSQTNSALVCLMVQDAVLMDSESIPNMLRHFDEPEVAGVFTCSHPVDDHDDFARREPLVHRSALGPFAKRFRIPNFETFESLDFVGRLQFVRFDNVCSIIKKTVWETHRFGKVNFGEDMAWSKKVQLAGHTIAYDPFARVIHSHMRPPEYTRKRGVTQSFFTTEIINSAPPGDFQEVPLPEVLKLEKQVAKDCRLLLKLIRLQTNRSGGVPIGEIRKALRRLHVKISFRKTSRHTTAFVNLRYQPLSMLGIMLLDRAATDEMKLEEIAVLIEKSRAAFDGDLWGNYIAAVRYFRNVLPSPLTDKLRASMVGV